CQIPVADVCGRNERLKLGSKSISPIQSWVDGATAFGAERKPMLKSAASGFVKGFGYRPVDDLSAGAEGRCPKASKEGTRGGLAGDARWRPGAPRRAVPAYRSAAAARRSTVWRARY